MKKFNTHTVKKSIKPLMMISVVATLLMAAMGTTNTNMNASAFNFGLKSKDVNTGSIDTNSLFSCTGAAINCINTNQNNNNEIANNTAVVVPGPTPLPGDCEEFIACFVDRLNPTQLGNLKFVLGLPVNSDNALLCETLDDLTEAELRAAIVAPVVGVTDAVASAIINCLLDAGFVFEV